jgi:hypothetical protein
MTREARIQLVTEGVVASYIHDISTRTAPVTSASTARPHGGRSHGRPARSRVQRFGGMRLGGATASWPVTPRPPVVEKAATVC